MIWLHIIRFRCQIFYGCWDIYVHYSRKRYDRAEREFIEAKVDLQKKSEMKEQLTEHLYTIIHQNEMRKAGKLSELMGELEMEAKEDGVQMPELPPLSTFNTITALQALTSPKSPSEFLSTFHKLAAESASEAARDEPIKSSDTSDVTPVDLSASCTSEKETSQKEDNSSKQDEESASKQCEGNTIDSNKTLDSDSPESIQKQTSTDTNSSNSEKDGSKDSDPSPDVSVDKSNPDSANTSSSTAVVPLSWTMDVVDIKKEPVD